MTQLDELLDTEREGWEALASGRGAEHYRANLAADALMAFPFGTIDREQALEAMAAAPAWARFELRDARLVELSADAGVLVYEVEAQREGQEVYRAIVSSTFVRVEGEWRLAFHQQTPVAQA